MTSDRYSTSTSWAAGLVLGPLLVLSPNLSNADSVDGIWCSKNGQRLKIAGDEVTTSSGEKIEGSNDTHHFVFDDKTDSAMEYKTLDIVLVDPNTIHVRYYLGKLGIESPTIEVWIRCGTGNS